MLLIESIRYMIPVQDSVSALDINKIVGFWNELDKVFILSTDILYFVNSSHIGRKDSLYVSDNKIRKNYYIIYVSERRARTLEVAKNRLLIHKGKLSYQLLKYFRMHKQEKSKEMEMMMKKINRQDWFSGI